jgi:hypothetical protein
VGCHHQQCKWYDLALLFSYSAARRATFTVRTDEKENQIFLIFKEIQNGTVAKSYMRKGWAS